MLKSADSKIPMVSIVIPVYNGSNYLAQAIDSALGQDYPNTEVIVVNDGSADCGKTEAIALSYGSKIRYYSKPNGGVATALNMGIEYMRGEYFSWLSHDDLYGKKKVSTQMKVLRRLKDKTTIIAGGYSLFTDDGTILHIRDYAEEYTKEQLGTPLFAVFHCAVNGCTLLIHKSHFQRVGLFDPACPTTQDYDMWFRMMRGKKIVYAQGIHMHSRVHPNQESLKGEDKHNDECNAMWIRLMDQLTDQERAQMSGTPREFYEEVFCFFQMHTSYEKVVMHAFNQCLRWEPSLSFSMPQQASQNAVADQKAPSFLSRYQPRRRRMKLAKCLVQVQMIITKG